MTETSRAFLSRLRDPEPLVSVELRPPRADQGQEASMDSWFGMHSAVRRLLARDNVLFITDGAVGTREEENLHHLVTNLEGEVSRERICPFLTTKHSLEYCLWYAARAHDAGCPALTVLGGDAGGAARCVPHGNLLRGHLRERVPTLALGGWANPHRDPARQVGFLAADDFHADFYLTQLVSHHHLPQVEAFLAEADRQGVTQPAVFGVFFYRSGNPKTLRRLARFFPVPVDDVLRDFEGGASPEDVCARTILALREIGVQKVYVSNLHPDRAHRQLAAIRERVG